MKLQYNSLKFASLYDDDSLSEIAQYDPHSVLNDFTAFKGSSFYLVASNADPPSNYITLTSPYS